MFQVIKGLNEWKECHAFRNNPHSSEPDAIYNPFLMYLS